MQELTEPVHLMDPLGPSALEPVPTAGCKICEALGRQREAARSEGNGSLVSDCNVEIRKHPHKSRGTK